MWFAATWNGSRRASGPCPGWSGRSVGHPRGGRAASAASECMRRAGRARVLAGRTPACAHPFPACLIGGEGRPGAGSGPGQSRVVGASSGAVGTTVQQVADELGVDVADVAVVLEWMGRPWSPPTQMSGRLVEHVRRVLDPDGERRRLVAR